MVWKERIVWFCYWGGSVRLASIVTMVTCLIVHLLFLSLTLPTFINGKTMKIPKTSYSFWANVLIYIVAQLTVFSCCLIGSVAENKFMLMLGVYAEPACMVIGLGIAVVLLVTCNITDFSKSYLIPCSLGYWFFRSYRKLVYFHWIYMRKIFLFITHGYIFCSAVFLVHSYIVIEKRFEDVVDAERKKIAASPASARSSN